MNIPKACLFDLDGVLIDSEPLHGEAWKETASFFDLTLTDEQIKSLQGRTRVDCADQILKWANKNINKDDFLSIHKPISKKLIKKVHLMPGSKKLLKWCSENQLPIALVTSSSRESVLYKCNQHNLLSYFSIKVFGDDELLKRGKPAPDPYLLAAKKLGLEPSCCWAIEDSISGATSALNAGCIVWLLSKKNDRSKKHKISYSQKRLIEIKDLDFLLENLEKYAN